MGLDVVALAVAKKMLGSGLTKEEVLELIKGELPISVSELDNDCKFIDNTISNLVHYYGKSETYTQDEINTLISNMQSLSVEVVEDFPTDHISTTTIYLKANKTNQDNIYDEYLYINGDWELIGNTSIDLSNYPTVSDVRTLLDVELANYVSNDDITDAIVEEVNKNLSVFYTKSETYSQSEVDEKVSEIVEATRINPTNMVRLWDGKLGVGEIGELSGSIEDYESIVIEKTMISEKGEMMPLATSVSEPYTISASTFYASSYSGYQFRPFSASNSGFGFATISTSTSSTNTTNANYFTVDLQDYYDIGCFTLSNVSYASTGVYCLRSFSLYYHNGSSYVLLTSSSSCSWGTTYTYYFNTVNTRYLRIFIHQFTQISSSGTTGYNWGLYRGLFRFYGESIYNNYQSYITTSRLGSHTISDLGAEVEFYDEEEIIYEDTDDEDILDEDRVVVGSEIKHKFKVTALTTVTNRVSGIYGLSKDRLGEDKALLYGTGLELDTVNGILNVDLTDKVEDVKLPISSRGVNDSNNTIDESLKELEDSNTTNFDNMATKLEDMLTRIEQLENANQEGSEDEWL